jgi:hypothetical protein
MDLSLNIPLSPVLYTNTPKAIIEVEERLCNDGAFRKKVEKLKKVLIKQAKKKILYYDCLIPLNSITF